jgi:hypothetical protein
LVKGQRSPLRCSDYGEEEPLEEDQKDLLEMTLDSYKRVISTDSSSVVVI